MTETFKTSEAQRRANKRYREKNKEAQKWQSYRRGAKNYILNKADHENLAELEAWIAERKQALDK